MSRRRTVTLLALGLAVALGATALVFHERLLYLGGSAYYQAELLWGRVPLERAIASGAFDEAQIARLRQVPEIKAYGASIGLSATDNYATINPTWRRTIWNVSASDPVKFQNVRWWFPVVGSLPYLGFFTREPADALAAELQAAGNDVYVRTAGAYSTLGWFRDPLTPGMLAWSEYDLANTILHELAHATVWIPGSVQFNESFANYVGDAAGRAYIEAKYGPDSGEARAMHDRLRDADAWRAFQHGLYIELDAVYRDPALDREAKLARKAQVFADLPARVDGAGFRDPQRFRAAAERGPWNNARLMQFRTYNRSRDWFAALHAREGDLLAFMHAVRAVTQGAADPYRALAEAVGASPEAP